MQVSRRAVLGALGGSVIAVPAVLAACGPQQPGGTPSPTPTVAYPTLTSRGQARRVVNQLRQAAGDLPVIKVDVTATTAILTVLLTNNPKAWQWEAGRITSTDPDVEPIKQVAFDPDDFQFDDVAALFATAASIAGSSESQQLQIVDYNQGQVLMTVTTRPESQPVFFRADGTAIQPIDFATSAGMAEGFKDAVNRSTQLLSVGYKSETGLWVDTPGKESGTVDRRTRPAKFPAWTAPRKGSADQPLFSPGDIQTPVLADLLVSMATAHNAKPADVSFIIDMRDQRTLPTIHASCKGTDAVYDLAGTDITAQVNK